MANLKLATNTEVRLERGVPLPAHTGKGRTAWPLGSMEVGDSFSFDRMQMTAVRSAIQYEQNKSPGKKFTARALPTETRCWRIA